MECTTSTSAKRRFTIRCYLSGGLAAFFAVLTAVLLRLHLVHGLIVYLFAILPALPILWCLWAVARYLSEETDEFQRRLHVEYLLWGIGGTLSITTVWGYLEDYTRVPHLNLVYVYPIFWLFVGLAMPVVNRRFK